VIVDIIDKDLKRITFNDGREIIMNNKEIDTLCKDSDYVETLETDLEKNKQVFEQVQKLVSKMNKYIEKLNEYI